MNPNPRTLFATGTRATCMEHPPPLSRAVPEVSISVFSFKF